MGYFHIWLVQGISVVLTPVRFHRQTPLCSGCFSPHSTWWVLWRLWHTFLERILVIPRAVWVHFHAQIAVWSNCKIGPVPSHTHTLCAIQGIHRYVHSPPGSSCSLIAIPSCVVGVPRGHSPDTRHTGPSQGGGWNSQNDIISGITHAHIQSNPTATFGMSQEWHLYTG